MEQQKPNENGPTRVNLLELRRDLKTFYEKKYIIELVSTDESVICKYCNAMYLLFPLFKTQEGYCALKLTGAELKNVIRNGLDIGSYSEEKQEAFLNDRGMILSDTEECLRAAEELAEKYRKKKSSALDSSLETTLIISEHGTATDYPYDQALEKARADGQLEAFLRMKKPYKPALKLLWAVNDYYKGFDLFKALDRALTKDPAFQGEVYETMSRIMRDSSMSGYAAGWAILRQWEQQYNGNASVNYCDEALRDQAVVYMKKYRKRALILMIALALLAGNIMLLGGVGAILLTFPLVAPFAVYSLITILQLIATKKQISDIEKMPAAKEEF